MSQQADIDVQHVVRSTGRTRSVLLRRTFPATVEQLWDTCTKPDLLARWYGTVAGDPRPAASLELPDVEARCEVLRCEAPHRLEVTWQNGDEITVVTLLLRSVDGGTELTLEHLGIISTAAGHGSGWERDLGRLEMFLTGGLKVDSAGDVGATTDPAWDHLPEESDVRWGRADGSESVTIVRELDVSRETVWTALTTAPGLAAWFGTVTGDLAVGGAWEVAFDDGSATGTVEECVPALSFGTTYRQGIDRPDDVHHVELTLTDVGSAIQLTLRHTFPAGATHRLRTGMTAGWNAYLASLASVMNGRPVEDADWIADFRIALAALG